MKSFLNLQILVNKFLAYYLIQCIVVKFSTQGKVLSFHYFQTIVQVIFTSQVSDSFFSRGDEKNESDTRLAKLSPGVFIK